MTHIAGPEHWLPVRRFPPDEKSLCSTDQHGYQVTDRDSLQVGHDDPR